MKCQEMSNCVHSTDFFFFAARAAKSKCQWKMRRTDGKGCVCRQMREWLGGQMRVKNIKIRHLEKQTFKKEKIQVRIRQVGCDKADILPSSYQGVWVGNSVHLEFKSSGF